MCVFWVEDWGWCIRCFVFGKWMYFAFWTDRYLVFWIGSYLAILCTYLVFWIGMYLASLWKYLVFWVGRCTVPKNPQQRGGGALLMEGNQRQAATMPRYEHSSVGLHFSDWIADKSFKLLNSIILQKSFLHVRTMQAASQCGQCKQC